MVEEKRSEFALPTALYSAAQVREVDRRVIAETDVTGYELMCRAGAAAFQVLRERWPNARKIAVCCGVGNNAGDGYVVAQLAVKANFEVTLFALGGDAPLRGEAAQAQRAAREIGLLESEFDAPLLDEHDVVVDALLGTGLDRPIRGAMAAAINAINGAERPVLALDIPTGLNADNGSVWGRAVHAHATVTFIGLKTGLFTAQGPDHCGDIYFAGLGVPPEMFNGLPIAARRVDYHDIARFLSRRPRSAHKGYFGHVLVVGGAPGMEGAPRMAGEAAARCGAGLISIAVSPENVAGFNGARPELMVHGVKSARELKPLLARATCVVVGPGLGQSDWARELLAAVFECKLPLVVDADALNLLASDGQPRGNWVLTPHPGEASKLVGLDDVNGDRIATVRALWAKWGGVVVLKGAGTLVCDDSRFAVSLCTEGNPGMASGGMGDVLSGVIGGLVAQGFSLEAAARIGVCVHGEAADLAATVRGERGLLAGDLFAQLHQLVNPTRDVSTGSIPRGTKIVSL